jgi:hypothetical protein
VPSPITLIACSVAPAFCAARVHLIRVFPVWMAFCAICCVRGTWFTVNSSHWKLCWEVTEYIILVLQAGVSVEALVKMASTVRNFGWKWNLLGVLALPAVAAAAFAERSDPVFKTAILWNQILGMGLGVAVVLACVLAMSLRDVCSPRAIFHAAIASSIFLLSGVGYRFYSAAAGQILAHWSPVVLFITWAAFIGSMGDAVPHHTDERLKAEKDRLARSRAAVT